jgi:alkaline phosphatase D
MKNYLFTLVGTAICCCFLTGLTTTTSICDAAEPAWESLFNGKNLKGWENPFDWGQIAVSKDKEIVLRGERKYFLVSDRRFKDFELEVELHVPAGGNSGIQFRSHYHHNRLWGYQAEVDTSDRQWAGGLYDEGRRAWLVPLKDNPTAQAAFKNSTWNHYRIRAVGDHIQIWVNGIATVDTHDAVTSEGYIALQHHGEKGLTYRFRNVRVREIEPPPVLNLITFGSCCRQEREQPIWDTIAAQQSQLFLMIGDNIYGDSEDIDILRAKYEMLGSNPGFKKLRATTPLLATWDDHDYGVNDGGVEFPIKKASQQLFNDFFNVPQGAGSRRHQGVYDSHVLGPVGKRVQIILLDTRYHRTPLLKWPKDERKTPGPYAPNSDPAATILGAEQWRWLEQQMLVPAEIRIIASSIQFLPAEHGWEMWENYPRDRNRLLDLISSSGGRSIVISGDRHIAEISKITIGDRQFDIYDITSSSLNVPSGGGNAGEPNRYRTADDNYPLVNFGSIEINWDKKDPEIELKIHNLQGQAVFINQFRLSNLTAK